jgi:hypothetical protein
VSPSRSGSEQICAGETPLQSAVAAVASTTTAAMTAANISIRRKGRDSCLNAHFFQMGRMTRTYRTSGLYLIRWGWAGAAPRRVFR